MISLPGGSVEEGKAGLGQGPRIPQGTLTEAELCLLAAASYDQPDLLIPSMLQVKLSPLRSVVEFE